MPFNGAIKIERSRRSHLVMELDGLESYMVLVEDLMY